MLPCSIQLPHLTLHYLKCISLSALRTVHYGRLSLETVFLGTHVLGGGRGVIAFSAARAVQSNEASWSGHAFLFLWPSEWLQRWPFLGMTLYKSYYFRFLKTECILFFFCCILPLPWTLENPEKNFYFFESQKIRCFTLFCKKIFCSYEKKDLECIYILCHLLLSNQMLQLPGNVNSVTG